MGNKKSKPKRIFEARELHTNEEVWLVKSWTGWHVIEPIKHPHTGEWQLENLVTRKGMVTCGIIAVIMLFLWLGFNDFTRAYEELANNPCDYCEAKREQEIRDFNFTLQEGVIGDDSTNTILIYSQEAG